MSSSYDLSIYQSIVICSVMHNIQHDKLRTCPYRIGQTRLTLQLLQSPHKIKVLARAKILKGVKNFVTLFPKVVSPISMKFGMMRVAGRAILVILAHFFGVHKFSIADISDISCRIATKFCTVRGPANGHFFPEFGDL